MAAAKIPIDTRPLFKPLDQLLIGFLRQLNEQEWQRQTIASKWLVKDVAAHLLDGNLRTLSMQRDHYFGEQPPEIEGYQDLVNWLNQLNASWVQSMKRLSPKVLTMLLELTGDQVSDYYAGMDPWDKAIFTVDWAGQETSYNWMHIAREYTEKWHHQQQIRDAIGDKTILNQQYFYPVISTFMLALPYTFRQVEAEEATAIKISIASQAGGDWYLQRRQNDWILVDRVESVIAAVRIPLDISWKLFTKSLRPQQVMDQVSIEGDVKLAHQVLGMVAVMA